MAISVEIKETAKPEDASAPEVVEANDLNDFLSDEEDDLDLDIVEAIEGDGDASSSASEEDSAEDEPEPKEEEEEVVTEAKTEVTESEPTSEEPAPDDTPKPEQQADDTAAATAVTEPVSLTPEQQAQAIATMEAQLVEHYKLDEATAEEFELNPSETLPKIMARVFVDAVTTTMEQVVQQLPNWSERHSQAKQVASQHENSFYTAWPALKSAEATPAVLRIGQVYRQLNPQASAEDFIRDVGAQAMVALRLPVNGQAEQEEAPKQAPFKPAGSAPKRGKAPNSDNVFAQLSDEMDAEDLDLD